ncbi:MAG: helix-turn-helix transcriptional regulator [Thiotrichales bacterium]|nr:helix-turn-helix transcriptional regulator [Thiotrichales bacterium]MBT7005956.1 helix-turn-helix transcriptional regulator [Thiotrichales bacterium]
MCGTAIIDPIDKHIGNKIRECRVRAKMSLQQTSEILSVSPGQLSRYESGENRINAGSLFYLARGFELPVSWFYEGFDISNERKRHLENVVHNSLRKEYSSSTLSELTSSMLSLWESLPNNRQRRKILEMLEAFA